MLVEEQITLLKEQLTAFFNNHVDSKTSIDDSALQTFAATLVQEFRKDIIADISKQFEEEIAVGELGQNALKDQLAQLQTDTEHTRRVLDELHPALSKTRAERDALKAQVATLIAALGHIKQASPELPSSTMSSADSTSLATSIVPATAAASLGGRIGFRPANPAPFEGNTRSQDLVEAFLHGCDAVFAFDDRATEAQKIAYATSLFVSGQQAALWIRPLLSSSTRMLLRTSLIGFDPGKRSLSICDRSLAIRWTSKTTCIASKPLLMKPE